MVTLSTLSEHIQNTFRDALAEIPQRVLLKYEGEMKNKSANVMISKWFPQRDILCMMMLNNNNNIVENINVLWY